MPFKNNLKIVIILSIIIKTNKYDGKKNIFSYREKSMILEKITY